MGITISCAPDPASPIQPTRYIYGRFEQLLSRRYITRQETAVRAADGQVMGWLLLFRDVTEERELAEQRADLSRMIVHDFRNPLTTLLTTLDLCPKTTICGQRPANALEMLDMVDSLMDINRMEAGQFIVEAEAMRLPPLV